MAESWKEQTLLNIVKLRYLDTPMYVDVSSVVASHELQTQLDAAWRLYPNPFSTAQDYSNLEARGRYTDRPTISYVPLTGERFINGLLRPLPPQAIQPTSSYRWPRAQSTTSPMYRDRFHARTLAVQNLLRSSKRSVASSVPERSVYAQKCAENDKLPWFPFEASLEEPLRPMCAMSNGSSELDPQKQEYLLVSGSYRRNADELAMLTRSIQEIMAELAVGIEVPSQDLIEGRATRIPVPAAGILHRVPPLRVRSGTDRPSDALRPCVTATHGSGWTIVISIPSAYSCSCGCSRRWPRPALSPGRRLSQYPPGKFYGAPRGSKRAILQSSPGAQSRIGSIEHVSHERRRCVVAPMRQVGVRKAVLHPQDEIREHQPEDRSCDHEPDYVARWYAVESHKNMRPSEQDRARKGYWPQPVFLRGEGDRHRRDEKLLKQDLDRLRKEVPRRREHDLGGMPRFGPVDRRQERKRIAGEQDQSCKGERDK